MAELIHILITGGAGQVGLELTNADWPKETRLHTPPRETLDLGDIASIRTAFAATQFSAVINSGAYTAVDRAETDVVAAFETNAIGPAVLAEMTRSAGIPLIQVSTDYVFDGNKDRPYVEDDPVAPLSVYGASKLAGELAVRSGNPRSVILRTAWILGVHRANFLKTMLRLAADRPVLQVVEDQIGCPTSAREVAATLKTITLRMINDIKAPTGVYHFANTGETSWAGLAREIFALSAERGGAAAKVEGITSSDYPASAQRPRNSRLATEKLTRDYGIKSSAWQDAVAEIVKELNTERNAA